MRTDFLRMIVVIGAFAAACADSTTPEPMGGETHFLHACDETAACGLGLECVCGVCTKPCTTDNTCKNENNLATCEAAGTPNGACVNPQASPVCDVECSASADCNSLGSGYSCEQGACRKLSQGACIEQGVLYSAEAVAADPCLACRCSPDDMACDCPDDADTCTVGALTYENGASDVPDPESCNSCTCDNGTLIDCTAADCPGTCHPLQAVSWQRSGEGSAIGDFYEITRGNFARRTPLGGAASCTTPLPECEAHLFDIEDLNEVLAYPDVREAFANAPSYYPDEIDDGAEVEIVIDGHTVRFGTQCHELGCNGGGSTVAIGLLALYDMLRSFEPLLYCSTNAACIAPLDPGACFDAGVQRYYHDAATRSCLPFTAYCGGNGGSANNFVTESECIGTCLSETFGVTETELVAAAEQACAPGATGDFEIVTTDPVSCPELDAVLALPDSSVVAFAPAPVERMVVGNGEVFWRDTEESLQRVSTSGGEVRRLPGGSYDTSALNLDGCHLYTAGADFGANVVAISIDDGSSRTLAQSPSAMETSNIVVTPDALFAWVHHQLLEIPRGGGPILSLATREVSNSHSRFQTTLAADATHLYWIDSAPGAQPGSIGHVLSMPMAVSEAPSTVAHDLPHPDALYQHAGSLYVLNQGTRDSLGNYDGNGSIVRIDLATGNADSLATFPAEQDRPAALVVDDAHVYWPTGSSSSGDFNVLRLPHGATSPETVGGDLLGYAGNFTADATHLYWNGACEVSGTSHYFIVRVPKPAP